MENNIELTISKKSLNNRNKRKIIIDRILHLLLFFLILICSSIIIVSVIFILIKGIQPFFTNYGSEGEYIHQSIVSFFTNSRWMYDGNGGVIFLILTTLYVVLLSLIVSIPTSIFTALFIAKIAPKPLKLIIRSAVDLLSSIPSVIYGLFGMGIICPMVNNIAMAMGMQTFGGKSILSAALVIAIMSIPTITTLSVSAIGAVQQDLINGSLALGASKTQTNMKIVLKDAKSGIVAGIILGVGRSLGEATAVQMVIGNNSNGLEFYNLFNAGSTIASSMLTGIGEASGIGYDVRFSLGIVLMFIIIITNVVLTSIKNYNKDKTKNGLVKRILSLFKKKEVKAYEDK